MTHETVIQVDSIKGTFLEATIEHKELIRRYHQGEISKEEWEAHQADYFDRMKQIAKQAWKKNSYK